MEEEFEEFAEHPQDVMEQYQDYPYDCDYWEESMVWAIRTTAMIVRELGKQNNKAAW